MTKGGTGGAVVWLAVVGLWCGAAGAAESTGGTPVPRDEELRWGGVGGVYFLAAPGELWVEVEKRDLNKTGQPTFLRAILFGPDRRVIEEQTVPDDGREKGSGPGPVQRVRMTAQVARKGVYGLNVTVSTDRYGENIAWGFRTNCPHYLVETSRGHRDAPHEEPLVLLNPDAAGDVCFLPRRGDFTIEAEGLPPDGAPLTVYDAEDREAAAMTVSAEGKASIQLKHEGGLAPWRLHLPRFAGMLQIDGVTRWTARDDFTDLPLWTPSRESWFAFAAFRWLLTPYNRTVYAMDGAEGVLPFTVHNNGLVETRVAIELEFPDGKTWPVSLSATEVVLAPRASAEVRVRYRLPDEGDAWVCHVRATPSACPEFTTYSTLEVRRGAAPAARLLEMPVVLQPYRHENALFGYLPGYPTDNEVYFDQKNRPHVEMAGAVAVWDNGAWATRPISAGSGAAKFRSGSTKIAFDRDNGVYLVGEQAGATALLYSPDGVTFTPYPVPGSGSCDIEQFSGHNVPDGPPPFVRYTLTARDPKLIWRRLNDLVLFVPEKDASGQLTIPPPILVSRKCIGYSGHSGMPSSVVSRGTKVHVVWAEATEPDENAPGVPTFAATYDRETATLSAPALVGYGPPANDVHNTPSITMDSKGYLHVLVGTHGRPFQYARSLAPNSAADGWTPAEYIGPGLRQTYVGMVCGQDDTVHIVFRLWRDDTAYFPASHYATLGYMRKPVDGPWSEPRPLVIAPFSEYSVFRHRLTIDRTGRLFLSYLCWPTFWFYRMDQRELERALLTSADQGVTWKLAEGGDLTR